MIGTLTNDTALTKMLDGISLTSKNIDKVSSMFLDWIPTIKGKDKEKIPSLLQQTDCIEHGTKSKIPIMIFDRHSAITFEEQKWLKQFNVILTEPVLLSRYDFKYLPFWTTIKTIDDIKLDDNKRKLNLGYISNTTTYISDFDKYYLKPKSINPTLSIGYNMKNIIWPKDKEEEVIHNDIFSHTNLTYSDIEYSIFIGTKKDYDTGRLDPYIFNALEQNCIPFLPLEHKYFSGRLVTMNMMDMILFEDMYDKIYIGMILEWYESIERYYPEMKINHAVDYIKKLLKE